MLKPRFNRSSLKAIMVAAICFCTPANALTAPVDNASAALIYKFTNFVDNLNLTKPVCVVGNEKVLELLRNFNEKGKKFSAVNSISSADTAASCGIVFVSNDRGMMNQVIKTTTGKPVLTVSDIKGFAAAGGILETKLVDGRPSFSINNRKAKTSTLEISSDALKSADEVF